MEPTQTRSGGSNKPSAAKRYGPLAVIVAIVAVIAIIVAVTSGGDDKKATPTTTSGGTGGSTGKAPWLLFDKADTKTDWGPNCDKTTGKIKIPFPYAAPCAKAFSGDNGGATTDGVTKDAIKIIVYQGDPAKNPLQAASVSKAAWPKGR